MIFQANSEGLAGNTAEGTACMQGLGWGCLSNRQALFLPGSARQGCESSLEECAELCRRLVSKLLGKFYYNIPNACDILIPKPCDSKKLACAML